MSFFSTDLRVYSVFRSQSEQIELSLVCFLHHFKTGEINMKKSINRKVSLSVLFGGVAVLALGCSQNKSKGSQQFGLKAIQNVENSVADGESDVDFLANEELVLRCQSFGGIDVGIGDEPGSGDRTPSGLDIASADSDQPQEAQMTPDGNGDSDQGVVNLRDRQGELVEMCIRVCDMDSIGDTGAEIAGQAFQGEVRSSDDSTDDVVVGCNDVIDRLETIQIRIDELSQRTPSSEGYGGETGGGGGGGRNGDGYRYGNGGGGSGHGDGDGQGCNSH